MMHTFLADGLPGQILPRRYTLRRPGVEDAQTVLRLIIACDIAEYGEPDTDLEDVLFEWEQLDLSRDAWLVLNTSGQLVGYASVSLTEDPMACTFNVHPRHASSGLNAIGFYERIGMRRVRQYDEYRKAL